MILHYIDIIRLHPLLIRHLNLLINFYHQHMSENLVIRY
jgi:hypothetical protein